MNKNEVLISRDGKYIGHATGGERPCSMEGCTGVRVAIRWDDGKLTYPCTKDMDYVGPNKYKLI